MLWRLKRFAGSCFRHRGAHQQLHLVIFGKQIETVAIAARTDMQIDIISQRARGDNRILLVFCSQMRKPVVGFGVNYGTFFNPADFVFLSLYAEKPATVFQDFELLPVHHLAHAVRHRGDAVLKVHLSDGDVDGFMPLMA